MIVAGQRLPILIATRPVDFRCGHRALALIVQTELKLDPHFRGDDRVPFETRRQAEDFSLGRNRSRDDLQGPRARQLCLAEGSGRGYAAVAGPARSLVRGAGLASGGCAAGLATGCGRVTQ